MRFTAQEEYGLRCLVQLARHENKGPLTIQEIAKNEKLTTAYVGKLMRILRRGGMVKSIHGPTGGYRLPRPAGRMSISEVLNVLGGRLYEPRYCLKYSGEETSCTHSAGCAIRPLWGVLEAVMERILSRMNLAHLASDEKGVQSWLHENVPSLHDVPAPGASEPHPWEPELAGTGGRPRIGPAVGTEKTP
jgi:Rrf2 family iron-sulfur cluster assembly transcriptional regulator